MTRLPWAFSSARFPLRFDFDRSRRSVGVFSRFAFAVTVAVMVIVFVDTTVLVLLSVIVSVVLFMMRILVVSGPTVLVILDSTG